MSSLDIYFLIGSCCIKSITFISPYLLVTLAWNCPPRLIARTNLALKSQVCYLTEATKAIASMPPGHCLGALEMLQ